jgi:hypothetical protein
VTGDADGEQEQQLIELPTRRRRRSPAKG